MSDDYPTHGAAGLPFVRYNREWLDRIRRTEEIIRNAPIDNVPLEHRALVRQQFKAHVEAFKNDLANGFNTYKAERYIYEIVKLATELIEESATKWAEWPAKAANGSS